MASVTSEGVAGTDRGAVTRRLRAVVLGPRGGGTTRRRASDAFRLGFAVVVVAGSIPVMRANSAAELWLVHTLNPPPAAIRWLVTSVPVPGGMGVVEAGLIGGLTSAGVPQDQAIAAVFIQRLFTAYLPPIWVVGKEHALARAATGLTPTPWRHQAEAGAW